MRIAFIGCGYSADFYAITLKNYPSIELAGVHDRLHERAARFAQRYGGQVYGSLEAVLADPGVGLVVNLTNPHHHYAVTKRCLEAGKHVYSEKPLALDLEQGRELVALARRRGLLLSSSPPTLLGPAAQTVWKLLREGAIGRVWLAYAELENGAVHQMNYTHWHSLSGIQWPAQDEFETGCTLEHAGYCVSWLAAFFGPATELTAVSYCLAPDKLGAHPQQLGDDFSLACIQFASGPVARFTCGMLAPADHRLVISGEEGVLTVEDMWKIESPVTLRRRIRPSPETSHLLDHRYLSDPEPVALVKPAGGRVRYDDVHDVDYASGIADMVFALREGRQPRLSAEFTLHVLEIMLTIAGAGRAPQPLQTTFEPVEPLF